uniref:Uncharacterized protein n=1 Tax=Glossina pallidipes TaxID=7398 RepID=A0A1A9Z2P9_GLOPL
MHIHRECNIYLFGISNVSSFVVKYTHNSPSYNKREDVHHDNIHTTLLASGIWLISKKIINIKQFYCYCTCKRIYIQQYVLYTLLLLHGACCFHSCHIAITVKTRNAQEFMGRRASAVAALFNILEYASISSQVTSLHCPRNV